MTDATVHQGPQSHRGRRGVFVIIILAVIFFTLLFLLLDAAAPDGAKATGASSRDLYVLPQRLRIRTEPTNKAPVVATVERGDKLRLLEDRGAWVRARTRNGVIGWTDRNGLETALDHDRRIARYAALRRLPTLEGVVEKRVPLYAGPGIFYSIVGELTPRKRVTVYTRDHDFYAIEAGGDIAYAEVDAIDLSASGTPQFNVAVNTSETRVEEEGKVPALPLPIPEPEAVASVPPPETRRERRDPIYPPVESRVYRAVPPGGTHPQVLDRVMPPYPRSAREAGVEGRVMIRAIIRRDGRVDDVEVLRDIGEGLGDAAARAVRKWRFRPATYQGEPIDVYYTVTVNFRLD